MRLAVRGAAATVTDGLLAVVLSLLTASTLGEWCAQRAVLALAIDDPASWWRGPLPLVLGAIGNLIYSLPVTWLAVGLARLAFGQTPGQALWRSSPEGNGRSLLLRWLDDYSPAVLIVVSLLAGRLRFTEVAILVGVGLWLRRWFSHHRRQRV